MPNSPQFRSVPSMCNQCVLFWLAVLHCVQTSIGDIATDLGHPVGGWKRSEHIYSNSLALVVQSIVMSLVRYQDCTNLKYCNVVHISLCFTCLRPSLHDSTLHCVIHGVSMLCIVLLQCCIMLQLSWCFSINQFRFWSKILWILVLHKNTVEFTLLLLTTWSKAHVSIVCSLIYQFIWLQDIFPRRY